MWYVYIAKCNDNSLYTGITTDPKRRENEHNKYKSGAKSLRGKKPIKIIYIEKYKTESEARKREIAIKQWRREYKMKLIQ